MLRQPQLFHQDVVMLAILPKVLDQPGTIFTDGNAACADTRFYHQARDLSRLRWDIVHAADWSHHDAAKRIKCAEVLVYPSVSPHLFTSIVCQTSDQQARVQAMVAQSRSIQTVELKPEWFFTDPGEMR